jgi:transcriptional regulator with XRE-family HTH domain
MARPTARPKSDVSLALAGLREFLNETQEEFARRFKVTAVHVARYESSRPPRGAALERLYKLAMKCGDKKSASLFGRALQREKDYAGRRNRICDPLNVREAGERLEAAYESLKRLKELILDDPNPDQHLLDAAEEVEAELLKQADLICLDGRVELLGGDEKENEQ